MARARQPRGVPSGGEFAGNDHDEAGGSLVADDAEYGEWEGPNDPALVGYDPEKYRHVGEYLGRHRPKPEDTLYLTRTQMNTALNDPDGKKAKGVARVFEIDALNGGGAREVTAPKDGTPIAILSRGGHTTFRVRGGRVVISADDISGSVIEAEMSVRTSSSLPETIARSPCVPPRDRPSPSSRTTDRLVSSPETAQHRSSTPKASRTIS